MDYGIVDINLSRVIITRKRRKISQKAMILQFLPRNTCRDAFQNAIFAV
jgi:hypothetical protein